MSWVVSDGCRVSRCNTIQEKTHSYVSGEEDDDVFDEYHAYAGAKARLLDEAFIEQFNENTVLWMARRYNWLPPILGLTPPSPVSIASNSSADFVMTRT